MPQRHAPAAASPAAAAPQSGRGQPSPSKPGHAMTEVFVSPRVVDREAFNDFAGSLRTLISDAQAQVQSLQAAAAEAEASRASLREVSARHQARFETTARLLASLDERCAQTERLLGAAKDAAGSLDAIRTDAESLIESHTRAVRDRLDQALTRTEARLAEFERVAGARALALERTLGERIEAGLARLDTHAARATTDLAGAAERVIGEISRSAQEATGRVRMAARSAEETLRQRETELTDLMARLDDVAAETEALLGHGRGPSLPGEDEHNSDAAPAPLPGSLSDLVQKASAAAERIERAQTSLASLRGEIARDLGVIAARLCP